MWPLNSFNFLTLIITKIIRPRIINPNVAIVYHYILHVHLIMLVDTTSLPLICCNAILVIKEFHFACQHIICITITATTNDIITVMNRKNIYCTIIKKGIFVQIQIIINMLISQIKDFFFMLILVQKVLQKF